MIRLAAPADWPAVDAVEASADALFEGVIALPPGEPGHTDRDLPGFVLVATEGDQLIGFAHVRDFDGRFHLQQLSVHPRWQRQGLGQRLLVAAERAIVERGGSVVTLRTFADVPWNAPFYRRHGYLDAELPIALGALLDAEQRLGLPAAGARVTLAKQVGVDVAPMTAVSVLPLRDGPNGLQVFVQYRAATMDFAAGAVVFPGGRVDAGDRPIAVPDDHLDAWAATQLPAAGVLAAAAIREVAEECGVAMSPGDLVPWDDWVTPPGGRRRFDVAFYLSAARPGQHWRNTTSEAIDAGWRRPADLLQDAAEGTVRLMPPTRALLVELASLPDVAAALAAKPAIVPVLHDSDKVRPRPSR